MAISRAHEAGASQMALQLAQMRKIQSGQVPSTQGVASSGGQNTKIGANQFKQAQFGQAGATQGAAGLKTAQAAGQSKGTGDQLAQFKQQFGQHNLNRPAAAEGVGRRVNLSA